MNTVKAVILDLDGTLLDTGAFLNLKTGVSVQMLFCAMVQEFSRLSKVI